MSRFLQTDHSKVAVCAAVGVGVATAISLAIWHRKKQSEAPPKSWRRVGELSDLICYPIKSCGPIRLTEMSCSILGLEDGLLRDRVFMVISSDGKFVTGRQYPTLVQVSPRFEGERMVLTAPGMMDIEVDVQRLFSATTTRAQVWGEDVTAVDCGEEVARWLSRFILAEDFGLRLVFYPSSEPSRAVREKNQGFPTMHPRDAGALHDATSFMMLNESSVVELNSHLNEPVTALNFRPNFVVKGPEAFDEDNWKWVKIGKADSHVVFRNVKPCTRCIFTNVNPLTGTRSVDEQPLKQLKKYRKFPETGENPVLGIHLGVKQMGKVSLGDSVYVEAS